MTDAIAITGATGFIGRTLVPLLAERRPLRVLARDAARLDLPARSRHPVTVVKGTLEDRAALAQLTDGVGAVIHLAGAIAAKNRAGFAKANVEGTENLLDAIVSRPEVFLTHVSSLAAREPGLTDYAWSKREGEERARNRLRARVVVLRPPAVYGPGDRATLPLFEQLSRQVPVLPVNRRQRLSLIHVADLANAIMLLTEARAGGGQVFEVDDETPGGYGWDDLVRQAGEALGRTVRPVFLPLAAARGISRVAGAVTAFTGGDPLIAPNKVAELYHHDWVCRGPSLASTTPWRARIRFREGFAETMQWYWREGWLRPPRHLAKPPATEER
ncbi:MAG: NAD-dependent epimerase/dehydratase family protein [Hyphomicrobiales bacterium]